MDSLFQWAAGILGTISLSVTGWIIMQIAKLKEDLSDHRLHVAEKYTSKEDTRSLQEEVRRGFDTINTTINSQLARLFDKLDNKVDKP